MTHDLLRIELLETGPDLPDIPERIPDAFDPAGWRTGVVGARALAPVTHGPDGRIKNLWCSAPYVISGGFSGA